MFCIECGQRMAEGAKFCAYCGTRRAVAPSAGDTSGAQNLPAKPPEAPIATPPPAVRSIRSTAEIMPIRMPSAAPVQPVSSARVQVEPPLPQKIVEPYEAERNDAPIPMEPALVNDESALETSAPVPADAYPQGRLYQDDGLAGYVAPVEPTRPAATPSERPASPAYTAVPFAAQDYSHDAVPAKRKISPVLIAAVIVALIALAGIVWMLRSSRSTGGAAANKVEITMFPTTAKVVAGKGIDFAATVTGAPTSEVTWSVEEGADAGQIQTRGASAQERAVSLYATYTPKAAGTYHLVATSTADPRKSASAEVTVAPAPIEAKRKH
jgi:hypothetical protein